MDAMEALGTIKLDRAAIIILVLADVFGCGLLAVFVCWPATFASFDAVKLGMVAMAVTLPIVTAGTFAYHISSIGQDYKAVSEGLATSVLYAVAVHVIVVLGGLAAGVLGEIAPHASWMVAPSREAPFWVASGCYILHMLALGRSSASGRPWVRRVVPALLALGLGAWTLSQFGHWKEWW